MEGQQCGLVVVSCCLFFIWLAASTHGGGLRERECVCACVYACVCACAWAQYVHEDLCACKFQESMQNLISWLRNKNEFIMKVSSPRL